MTLKLCARCRKNPGEFPGANYGKGRLCAPCIVEDNATMAAALAKLQASSGSVLYHPGLIVREHRTEPPPRGKKPGFDWLAALGFVLLAILGLAVTLWAWRAYGSWVLGYDGSVRTVCHRTCDAGWCADVCKDVERF